jgi:peroxiredoxin (alkyl hydroperoxide reductase subunit C)
MMLDADYTPGSLVGLPAPSFSLAASGGQHVTLEQYRGKWLILLFYPRDFSHNCPAELLAFSRRILEFSVRNTEVLAVSTDSVEAHEAWVRLDPSHDGSDR